MGSNPRLKRQCKSADHGGRKIVTQLAAMVLTLLMMLPVADSTITFTLTNVERLALYQTARLSFKRVPGNSEPAITEGDSFYFVEEDKSSDCTSTVAARQPFKVSNVDGSGTSGYGFVSVRRDIFSVGGKYVVCYIAGDKAHVVHGTDGKALIVHRNVYTDYVVDPPKVTAGLEMINITLYRERGHPGAPNNGLRGENTVFLVPCTQEGGECNDLDDLAGLCASRPKERIDLHLLHGAEGSDVKGTLSVPLKLRGSRCVICVPYCGKESQTCSGFSPADMSYAVVVPTPLSGKPPFVEIAGTNPSRYIVVPSEPQARERGYVLLFGNGLSVKDEISIIHSGETCGSKTASLLNNLEVSPVTLVNSSCVNVTFVAPELIKQKMVGHLCYRLASSGLWTTVRRDATAHSRSPDFVVDVLQPTGFTVSPEKPVVGQPFTVTFNGEGLDAKRDSAFVVLSATCETAVEQISKFSCEFVLNQELNGKTQCNVVVDPPMNGPISAQICYQKGRSAVTAMISGSLMLAGRNPRFRITPYPLYAGQMATMTFVGDGLSAGDTVSFVPPGRRCGGADDVNTFSLQNVREEEKNKSYSYDAVGRGGQCLRTCYFIRSLNVWSVARMEEVVPVGNDCRTSDLYVRDYSLTFMLPGPYLSARETATLVLSSVKVMPSAVKLVRVKDNCVLTFCNVNGRLVTACEMEQHAEDYVSPVSNWKVDIFAAEAVSTYVLCIKNGGDTYIPVPQVDGDVRSPRFIFMPEAPNPRFTAHSPQVWRVGEALLSSTFRGHDLDPNTDEVRVIADADMASPTAKACPGVDTKTKLALTSSLSSEQPGGLKRSSRSSVTAVHGQSHLLYTGAVVHLCYVWGGGKRITHAGSVVFQESLPLNMALSPKPRNGYTAGKPIKISFQSNTTSLKLGSEELYFYRFPTVSGKNVKCYCDNSCPEMNRVSYPSAVLKAGKTLSETEWMNVQGFDNHGYSATYVACYSSRLRQSVTYLGTVTVGMSQPAYYTVKGSAVLRRGSPIVVTAVQQCSGELCADLTERDEMRLIPISNGCHEIDDSDVAGIKAVGAPVVNNALYSATFVVGNVGSYRVCYRIDDAFVELKKSSKYTADLIVISEADPDSFESIPQQPTAGQFVSVVLSCSSSACLSCSKLRLVEGESASCWDAHADAVESTNCEKSFNNMVFPNKEIKEGKYTVCYGSSVDTSMRVPGTLVVEKANPVAYTVTFPTVQANQYTDAAISIFGTGLSVGDEVFLLPSSGISCHDLRKDPVRRNSTLREWLAPSVKAPVLQIDPSGTRATWVVSSGQNVFNIGILSDPSMCDNPGKSCTMKLCYKRQGATWAQVRPQDKEIKLVPPNPSSVSFHHKSLVVDMYTIATVSGTDLSTSDFLTVRRSSCSGEPVTVSVGKGKVNDERTSWTGVVRFTTTVNKYAFCYTRGGVVTEISNVITMDKALNVGARNVFFSLNGTSTHRLNGPSRYEMLSLSAQLQDGAIAELKSVSVIPPSKECLYKAFKYGPEMEPKFEPALNLKMDSPHLFIGRITVPAGPYAICMEIGDDMFRVTTNVAGGSFNIEEARPSAYRTIPVVPLVDQESRMIFDNADALQLSEEDTLTIIDGSLYECGAQNMTVVSRSALKKVQSDSEASALEAEIQVPKKYTGVALTVCYQRKGAFGATVPREDKEDRNLVVVGQIPSTWEVKTVHVQERRTLTMIFKGDKLKPDFLQETDEASLVLVSDEENLPSCGRNAAVAGGKITILGNDAVWTITSSLLVKGKYIVCYKPAVIGISLHVSNPLTLVVEEMQSPTDVYMGSGDTLEVFSGQQFHLMFETKVDLNPVLSYDNEVLTKDAVLFSSTIDCSRALTNAQVAVIPDEFQYKVIEERNALSDFPIPYMHLVIRADPGKYYVCMRRAGRKMGEAFFEYEVIGQAESPAALTVRPPPISSIATRPTELRASVPGAEMRITYGRGYREMNIEKLFFIHNEQGGEEAAVVDACYRPTAQDAILGEEVKLLKPVVHVDVSTGRAVKPFPAPGEYKLCVRLRGRTQRAASVVGGVLTVGKPSPASYSVREVIDTNASFDIEFTASDPIFAPHVLKKNTMKLYMVQPGEMIGDAAPSCENLAVQRVDNVGRLVSIDSSSGRRASVTAKVASKAYLYVCFLTYGQIHYFPVPNSKGGYFFSVGLTGAHRYVVKPATPFMGQQVSIALFGNLLTGEDRVKVVKMDDDVPDSEYDTGCTETARSANAETPNDVVGGTVNVVGPSQVRYTLRINTTGRFILCYRSSRTHRGWLRVQDMSFFEVHSPHPTSYGVSASPAYVSESVTLTVYDNGNMMGGDDEAKLVTSSDKPNTFVCTEDAKQSKALRLFERVEEDSSMSRSVFKVCSSTPTDITLCYSLRDGSWAEVPLQTPPRTYVFESIKFLASPFQGHQLTPLNPRPHEPFNIKLTSSDEGIGVVFVNFARGKQGPCASKPAYVKPPLYKKGKEANVFTVAMPTSGEYQLYLGIKTGNRDRVIAYGSTIKVDACNPCSFSPSYTFLGSTISLKFTSSTGGGFSSKDTIRLVSVAQSGSGAEACNTPKGPFAARIFKPVSEKTTESSTTFSFTVSERGAFAGEYYVCYRLASSGSNYAAVTSEDGTEASTFRIYPKLRLTALMCPSEPAHRNTLRLTLRPGAARHPQDVFLPDDKLALLPESVQCNPGALENSAIATATLERVQSTESVWLVTLPGSRREKRYQLCFFAARSQNIALVEPPTLLVAPQNPISVRTKPAIVTSSVTGLEVMIEGRNLQEKDELYVVPGHEKCSERCDERAEPVEMLDLEIIKSLVNTSFMSMYVINSLEDQTDIRICYRRASGQLVSIAAYDLGTVNPQTYQVSFVPRVGTRPVLTFAGFDLTTEDRVMLVPEGYSCDDEYAVASGVFIKQGWSSESTRFHLPLIGVAHGSYTVCYDAGGSFGYVQMREPLAVRPGGPSSYVLSNTPMLGRPTEVLVEHSTYAASVNDGLRITCASCSCFEESEVDLAFGLPSVTVTEAGKDVRLRFGVSKQSAFAVCYRVHDSGYARVGNSLIRLTPSWPQRAAVPSTSIMQGQRFVVELAGPAADGAEANNSPHAFSDGDALALVVASRGCWDNPASNRAGVLTTFSSPVEVTKAKGRWRTLVPSLGPRKQLLESPSEYIVCYRESGQEEFLEVPLEGGVHTISPVQPAAFTTSPEVVMRGMLDVKLTFPRAVSGDAAYIVSFDGDEVVSDDVCDSGKPVTRPATAAFPSFRFNVPRHLEQKPLVVCYIKAGATVAEVPQLLEICPTNPERYVVESASSGLVRQHEYATLTFVGEGLSAEEDAVAFRDEPCASDGEQSLGHTTRVRRVSAMTSGTGTESGKRVSVVVQFVTNEADALVHVCYRRNKIWTQVGAPLVLYPRIPRSLRINPDVGKARVGQNVRIELVGGEGSVFDSVAVISANDSAPGSWCHNYTRSDVLEPVFEVHGHVLSVPVWETEGRVRICVNSRGRSPSDVPLLLKGGDTAVEVLGPNPLRLVSHPLQPRVGQRVDLTFHLAVRATEEDRVRITRLSLDESCESAMGVSGFEKDLKVVVGEDGVSSSVILTDEEGRYSSFALDGVYTVCYYSAVDDAWGLVGGTLLEASFVVTAMSPRSWKKRSGSVVEVTEPFTLEFDDPEGSLDAKEDQAWLVLDGQQCGASPVGCITCVVLPLDGDKSTDKIVVTKATSTILFGKLSVCYRLREATPVMLPEQLTVNMGKVQCVENVNVTAGQQQVFTFVTRQGVDVRGDSWRVSSYNSDPTKCADHYESAFDSGHVNMLPRSSDAEVRYEVEWPITMTEKQYRICYEHEGVAHVVCTCQQVHSRTGDCFVTVIPSPLSLAVEPSPTYVGQTLKLRFTYTDVTAAKPIVEIKLVSYIGSATACGDEAEFSFAPEHITQDSTGSHVVELKVPENTHPGRYVACARREGDKNFIRPSLLKANSPANTLSLRPYVALSLLPNDSNLHRVGQVIQLKFAHSSTLEDDVVGLDDQFTLVEDEHQCDEAFINSHDWEGKVLGKLTLGDSSFSSLPATVKSADSHTRTSSAFVAFNEKGVGNWVVCYKLKGGTWAVVSQKIVVQPPIIRNCSLVPTSEHGNHHMPRAMQYVQAHIEKDPTVRGLFTVRDAIRVVPHMSPCAAEEDAVFTSTVDSVSNDRVAFTFFTPKSGEFKVCYRFSSQIDSSSAWSPVCNGVEATPASPIGEVAGCMRHGQVVTIKLTHNGGRRFSNKDRYRFVHGSEECSGQRRSQTTDDSIVVGGRPSSSTGSFDVDSETNTFLIPPVVLSGSIKSLRLCYHDAAGGVFAVPLGGDDATSWVVVGTRTVSSVEGPRSVSSGQRVLWRFNGATSGMEQGQLIPYDSVPPVPYAPGPSSDGHHFDVVVGLSLPKDVAYDDAYCHRTATRGFGVYGNRSQTVGCLDATSPGRTILCYRPAGCSFEGVGSVFHVTGPNPSRFVLTPVGARRGQLLQLAFERNYDDPKSTPLSPHSDRAKVIAQSDSCWDLSDTDGTVVEGSIQRTELPRLFFPAQPASQRGSLHFKVCYRLRGQSWAQVPNGEMIVAPANPSMFTVLNGPARTMQLNVIEFSGQFLGAQDSVKIVDKGTTCGRASAPSLGAMSYATHNDLPAGGVTEGWNVQSVAHNKTAITVGFMNPGTYSVCYRLANDVLWTMLHGDLTVLSRSPTIVTQMPYNPAEGELFTLNFSTAAVPTEEFGVLSARDQIQLYFGRVMCHAPKKNPDIVVTSPSRSDQLPRNLFFQLVLGKRGEYTLCYLRASRVVWGFDPIVIRPNPWDHSTHLPAGTLPHRNQLINIVFAGSGLTASPTGADEVKLLSSAGPPTDEACQNQKSPASVHYYPLVANGTHSVQTVRISSPGDSTFWICYRQNGAQFKLVLGDPLTVVGTDAVSAVPLNDHTLFDGEVTRWSIRSLKPSGKDALLFYSTNGCNDFPYYVVPTGSPTEFPSGVAHVDEDVAFMRVWPPSKKNERLSVCHYANGVVTLLIESSIEVKTGTPSVNAVPVLSNAREIFSFVMDVKAADGDHVALYKEPGRCGVGDASESGDELFVQMESRGPAVLVSAAVDWDGTYHICYSRHSEECSTRPQKKCSRIVGTVVASAPYISGWSMSPAAAYTTDRVEITLLRRTIAEAISVVRSLRKGIAEEEQLWLAPLSRGARDMRDVALACMASRESEGRVTLSRVPNAQDKWAVRLNVTNAYGLCFIRSGGTLPVIFSPFSRAGPVVKLTTVTVFRFLTEPSIMGKTIIVLNGYGLSHGDKLTAVALPPGTQLTNNICIDDKNFSSVQATIISSPGMGLYSMMLQVSFASEGRYVLCFEPAGSPGKSTLLTPSPFEVGSSSLVATVVSAALRGKEMTVEFRGTDLKVIDEAALVKVTSVGTGDVCPHGNYSKVKSVNSGGTVSIYVTVPQEHGPHIVCYRKPGRPPTGLPNVIVVSEQPAVTAIFSTQPICTEGEVCSVQPVVSLLVSKEKSLSLDLVAARMRLKREDGGYADELLVDAESYSHTSDGVFTFTKLLVSSPGRYVMEAHISLANGVEVVAQSSTFVVSSRHVAPPHNLSVRLSCSPVGIIPRPPIVARGGSANSSIRCTIAASAEVDPTVFKVEVSAGVSSPVSHDRQAGGLHEYTFVVMPKYEDWEMRFLTIAVTPSSPAGGWQAKNSPVIVRIGSVPDHNSVLHCASTSMDMPLPTMVRAQDKVICRLQGRRTVNGKVVNVVALPEYLRLLRETDDDHKTQTPLKIAAYPESTEGEYSFEVDLTGAQQSVSVIGSAPFEATGTQYSPVHGSPSRFTIIGEPNAAGSSLVCVSDRSKSTLWFSPSEPVTCSLKLAAGGQPVTGIPQDFVLQVTNGEVVQLPANASWGNILSLPTIVPAESVWAKLGAADTLDRELQFAVTYKPLGDEIARTQATLVYVTHVDMHHDAQTNFTVVRLKGSGLSKMHRYGVRKTPKCSDGVDVVARTKTEVDDSRGLWLDVDIRAATLYICYAPSDQTNVWQLLTDGDVVSREAANRTLDKWFVLFIVGIVTLFIFVLLAAILMWMACVDSRRKVGKRVVEELYIRPRPNDRFTCTAETEEHSNIIAGEQGLPATIDESVTRKGGKQGKKYKNECSYNEGRGVVPNVQTPRKQTEQLRERTFHKNAKSKYVDLEEEMQEREIEVIAHTSPPRAPEQCQQTYSTTDYEVTTRTSTSTGLPQFEERRAERRIDNVTSGNQKAESTPQYASHAEAEQPATDIDTAAAGAEGGERELWAGPFVVTRHTARPLVEPVQATHGAAGVSPAAGI